MVMNLWIHGDDLEITSWEIDGETVETVSDFIFLGTKVTICSNFGAPKNKA